MTAAPDLEPLYAAVREADAAFWKADEAADLAEIAFLRARIAKDEASVRRQEAHHALSKARREVTP